MDIDRGPWRRVGEGAGLLRPDGSIAATVFAEMSALAARTGSINLGQGFPDEDGPLEVLDAAREAIAAGRNQYPPGRGTPELLAAIARHQRRFYGLDVDPATQILVTAGATEALAASILALTEPGDEIVTFEPYYDAYAGLVALSGATLVTVPLRWPDFAPDPDELRAAVSDRTRIILVNDPHNPTGTTFDAATRDLIVELAHRHDAVILTDEVYEHLTFSEPHIPLSTLPGAGERTITVSSAGKTFNTTGWKIGWLVAPAALVSAILTVKQYLTYVSGSPFQPAIARGLDLPDSAFDRIASDLRQKRDVLTRGLQVAGFDVSVPAGSYFTVVDVGPLGFDDAEHFCAELPALAGVVGVPVTAFASTRHRSSYRSLVRFAFCKRLEVLEEASARLAAIDHRSTR
ncbi:aminotransferase class I/II-fold pyridoxal phosphate-dependent enzyme [Labedella endophytica]|uniref:Aminotransferase class I/II-fold pyridoxal phosphate-dependent enzyme n=1 Tax=Labedella endophytica TaxID=1523160 RepID=A0A433JQV7_9MICO|nr:aminotransferase class I/II-fold pyridoxal phosphate-dependent enzyme [Labedella endophytica]RUQ99267.1 aminotransferase class I/II-fold pyridoxal phosphate-dependent enzyme [Labedella endophytica]